MDIRNGLRNAMPRTYRRVSFGYNAVRLFGSMRGPSVNFDMLRDVINKANGTSEKECPICGFTGLFRAFGSPPRWDALCPSCGSLERHRLFALVLNSMSPILTKCVAVLHFAPEKCIKTLLQRVGIQYTSADLHETDVDLELNIEHIDINNGQYDIIVCSHVLEHVNDKTALSELRRILKSDGVLIIMVPILEGCDMTYEDDTITDSKDRLVHFGQDGSCESIRRRFYRQTDWRRLPG